MTEAGQPRLISHAGRRMDPRTGPPARAGAAAVGRSPGAGVRSVVQFRRPLTRDERFRFQRGYGLALADYVPDNAYVESVPPGRLADLEREPLVRAVMAYGADLRRPAARRELAERRGRYEAVLFPDADAGAAVGALRERGAVEPAVLDDRAHGGTVKIRFFVSAPVDSTVAGLAEVDDVRWLDEVGEPKLDAAGPVTAAPPARGWAEPLWRRGLSGAGQVIGLIDSPIDLGHRFFAGGKVVGVRNATGAPPRPHGTFVAGIAAGDDPAAPGAHPDRGVAWAARLTCGNIDDLDQLGVLAYLAAAAADGARVHTNSWHDEPEPQYNQLAADLDAFAWANEDHVILGSAGNTGERMGPPGTAKNVLSVAAARGPAPAGFGDGATGPAADGRQKPEVMAPGCAIRSAVAGTAAGVELDRVVFGGPGPRCASSWATPAVAALAALVRQYYAGGHHPAGALVPSGALVRATLIAGCLPDGAGVYPGDTTGWGVVRVDETLAGPPLVRDVRHAGGLATGESAVFELEVGGADRPLTVTLVWTDPPGLAGSDAPAVNTLDLVVTPPGGGPALRGDPSGTVRRVVVPRPAAGRWTVRVSATAVHVGNPGQGYALAVLGDLAANQTQLTTKEEQS
ncbi:S8 family serine peptidase [Dactylosporangium sp. CA-092794]|uniref:S8 family serine peptidase n=1 Tax=Dactylosporangium sp. CA-092794 TaxID=3239929 RepID=UPI003D8CB2BC